MSVPPPADGPVSRLRWYPERGFELDLNAVVGDTAIMLVAVPLPADGTVELRSGRLELDKLEILFKAQVDVQGAPGQLTEAFVTLLPAGEGEVIRLEATVENVEAEDVNKLTVDVPVDVPGQAPEAGGPRPDPVDEAELDWDDDDTHEAFFKDPLTQEDPLPGAARAGGVDPDEDGSLGDGDEAPPSAAERGFDRLLKALLSEDPMVEGDVDDDLDDDLDEVGSPPASDDAAQRVTGGGTVLSLLAGVDAVSDEAPSADPADAQGLLAFLVEREALELEEGHSVDDLVAGAAPILASPRSPGARAAELSEWLFSQDAVAELYIGDDDLASLIGQW